MTISSQTMIMSGPNSVIDLRAQRQGGVVLTWDDVELPGDRIVRETQERVVLTWDDVELSGKRIVRDLVAGRRVVVCVSAGRWRQRDHTVP